MNKVILSSVIDIISGGTPKTSVPEFWNGDIGWLSVTDFNNDNRYVYNTEKTITDLGVKKSNTKYLNRGDIIISARGTVGALSQIGSPLCFNQSCFGLRGKNGILDNDFLYYSLKNYVKNIIKRSQGSVFGTINLASFDLMEIEIPILISEQQKIASVLSDLDAKIELNNKINAELEAMAKLIYDYWFVQFDFPFDFKQNKVADESSNPKDVKPYKSSGGKMVYNEELKREIPEGWEVKKLINEMDVQYGYPFSTELFNENKIGRPVVRIRDILNNSISLYTSEDVDEKYRLDKGDLLIGMDGNFHMNFWDKNNCYLNQRSLRIRKSANSVASHFQVLYDIAPYIKAKEKNISRTTVAHLSARDVNDLNVLIPNSKEFIKNTSIFDLLLKQIIINRNENQQLSELRDWLLPMLMNGQVKVKDAYEKMEEVGMAAEGETNYK